MSASTSASPDKAQAEGAVAQTEGDINLEKELYRALPDARPIGRTKHFIIIKLQGLIHKRTQHLIPIEELWEMLGEMYDLEALEDMHASSGSDSIPQSPNPLSPVARNVQLVPASQSVSSLSSPSATGTPEPETTTTTTGRATRKSLSKATPIPKKETAATSKRGRPKSRSAGIIDHGHFKGNFELPVVDRKESDEDEAGTWSDMVYPRAQAEGGDGDWGGLTEDQAKAEAGQEDEGEHTPADEGDEDDAEAQEEGEDEDAETKLEDAEEGETRTKSTRQYGKSGGASSTRSTRTKAVGTRTRRARSGTSPLSEDESAAESVPEKKTRGRNKGPVKRKRESGEASTVKAESESEAEPPAKADKRKKRK